MDVRISSSEQEELVIKNQKLVPHIAKKYIKCYSDFEDLISVGKIGLAKAAATFDKSKGNKFSTYAALCIQNEILMFLRSERRQGNVVFLEEPIGTDKDGNEITLGETIADDEKDFREVLGDRDVIARTITSIINLLEPREKVIFLYRISGKTQSFIGEALKISRSYVSRYQDRINKKIESYFETNENFKKVFFMDIVENWYEISFSQNEIKDFNKIFARFLKKHSSLEKLSDFEVVSNKAWIRLIVPAVPESFSFIAQIIQSIYEYNGAIKND